MGLRGRPGGRCGEASECDRARLPLQREDGLQGAALAWLGAHPPALALDKWSHSSNWLQCPDRRTPGRRGHGDLMNILETGLSTFNHL